MLIAVLVFVGYPIAFVIDHKRAKRAEKERKERLQTKVVYVQGYPPTYTQQDNELDVVGELQTETLTGDNPYILTPRKESEI